MKKVLFATTALVAFSAAASAEVLLTGEAEMGLFSSDSLGVNGGTDGDVEFFTDVEVTFTLTGETDGGLAFGTSIELEDIGEGSDGSDNNKEDGGVAIFLSGGFGTLTLGDTDGALDWALGEVAFAGGSIADDETAHGGYNGNYLDGEYDGQIVRYDYSVGDFGFAISAEIDDNNSVDEFDEDGNLTDPRREDLSAGYALGVRYALDFGGSAINLGLGYQTLESDGTTRLGELGFDVVSPFGSDIEAIGVSANGTFGGGFTAGIEYTMFSFDEPGLDAGGTLASGDVDHIGVGLGYSVGAISLAANYGKYDADNGVEQDGYGLIANYDLGGGAIVQLGYGSTDSDQRDDIDTFSFGVRMNF